jgi:hypothetical protein
MIKVNNLNGVPEYIPAGIFAIHSDDNYFYFFDSDEERDIFLNNLD